MADGRSTARPADATELRTIPAIYRPPMARRTRRRVVATPQRGCRRTRTYRITGVPPEGRTGESRRRSTRQSLTRRGPRRRPRKRLHRSQFAVSPRPLCRLPITQKKPAVGCVFRNVPVAGPATLVTVPDMNFTVTGSQETRVDLPCLGPETGSTFLRHRDVRPRRGDQSRRDMLSDVFAPARHQTAKPGMKELCKIGRGSAAAEGLSP